MLLIGILTGIPLAVLPFYPEESKYAPAFLIPMAFSLLLGAVLCRDSARREETSEWRSPLQQGSLPVLFVWLFSLIIGAVPFYISGQLDPVRSLFESVSGWTTAGMTVIDVTATPFIFLFHRSFMQYCGGLGFIIMMSAIVQNKQSVNMYNAEGHYDRPLPNIGRTARFITLIYSGLLVVGTILYRIFGMKLFDAVCHAMSALATAGFSTQAKGISAFSNRPVEIVTIVLMIIGASNFAALLMLSKGKLRQVFRISEMRFMLCLLAVTTPMVAFSLMRNLDMGVGESLLDGLFGVATTVSTTGYATMEYTNWPPFASVVLIFLMLIGGSAGSTAGGLKLSRAYLLLRSTQGNIRKRVSSSRKVTAPSYTTVRGKTPIDEALISDTISYAVCFVCILFVGTLLITLTENETPYQAFLTFASAFTTSGIFGNMENAGNATLVVEMAGMILGRLEIFIVFIGFSEVFRAVGKLATKGKKHAE